MSKPSWNINATSFVPRSKAAAPASAQTSVPATPPVVTPAPVTEQPTAQKVAQSPVEDSGKDSWETHSVTEEVKQEKASVAKTEPPKHESKNETTEEKTEEKKTSAAPTSAASTASTAFANDAELSQLPQQEEIECDPREHLNIIFIGHVDAGKSTVSGNLLYLTGKVDKRLIEKYEREAKEKNRGTWFFAYIMDTNEEERSKGITIEVGRAHFETQNHRYTILDAPGHKNFVPNMIAGAAQADVGILVISARQGEFEAGFERGGQTREHAMLAKTLGIRPLIVVINKMDERGWAKDRYDEIVGKLSLFLKKECQYAPKDIIFLPISGYTGANLLEPVSKEACPWYDGPSLVQILDTTKIPDRNPTAPVRIPVIDRFKEMGTLNVFGKIESGTCFKGQKLVLMPNNVQAKVTQLLVDEKLMKRAGPGENVIISFTNLEETDISAGFVICEADRELVPIVSEFVAQLVIVEMPPGNPLFMNGYDAVMHIHTSVRECSVLELLSELDKKTKKPSKKKPIFVKTGAIVTAKLSLATPVCLELFEHYAQLGRFTLRDKGRTVAVGKVIKLV